MKPMTALPLQHRPVPRWAWVVILLSPLVAASMAWVATRQGPGVDYDASEYLWAARSVTRGTGLSTWWSGGTGVPGAMVSYPPLFPLLVSLPVELGLSPEESARWENILLLIGNVALITWMTWRYSGERWGAALFAALLAGTSHDLLVVHSAALTEPLFLLTGIGGLCCLAIYLDSRRLLSLIGAALLIAAAFVTRYVGGTLVVTGTLALLMMGRQRLRNRIAATTAFLVISCLPMLLWLTRNAQLHGSPTGRHLLFHPFTLWHVRTLVRTCSMWIVPLLVPQVLAVVIVAGGVLLAAYLCFRVRRPRGRARTLGSVLSLFITCYAALLFASICLFDASTPTDARLMSPVYVCLIPLTLGAVCRWIDAGSPHGSNRLAARAGFVLLMFYLFGSLRWTIRSAGGGLGYSSRAWRDSPLIAMLSKSPGSQILYSNGDDALAFLTGHGAEALPNRFDPIQDRESLSMDLELEKIRNGLHRSDGRVIFFHRIDREEQIQEPDIVARLGLVPVFSCDDGAIYRLPN